MHFISGDQVCLGNERQLFGKLEWHLMRKPQHCHCALQDRHQIKVLSQQFNCLSYIFNNHLNSAEEVNEAHKQHLKGEQ